MTNINKDSTGTDTSMTEKAKEAAGSASEQVKAHAKDVADTVATEAGNYAGQAKDATADEVKNVSSALRTAADEMRRGSPQERTFSQIADGLADASDSLRDKDLGEMVTAVSDFAKRNPLVFLGSAALIGFAATRFAKASRTGSSRADYGDRNDDRMARPAPGIPSSTANQAGGVQSPAIAPNRERNNL